jgi:hypothetical protein
MSPGSSADYAMDEIIKLVADRTGLAPDKAKIAVTTVLGFIKGKMPPAMASQLDSLIAGGGSASSATGALGDVTKNLGGMLGGAGDR